METRISERDLETLSAYLDGQINARERAQLEARLRAENELRGAYEHLRTTRALLRSAPKIRAPRNFTLSPRMVGNRQTGKRQYPVLSLASALASVLFVLVILSDFLVSQSLSPVALQVLNTQAGETVELLQAPAEGGTLVQSQAPESQREAPVEDEILTPESVPVEEPAFSLEMEQIGPESTPFEELAVATPEGAQPLDSSTDSAEAQLADDDSEVQPLRRITIARMILRIVEVVLILVAVTSGLGAIIIYRRQIG
jgi:hypothetical protein